MFDTVIRNDSAVSILTVDEKLLKESMGILVDETEQIVEEGTLTLASMKQEYNRQVGEFAAGIKEKRGNAHLSFSNLKNSVIKENAIAATNQTEAMKVINNVAIKGAGHNYMPKTEANRVFAKALVDGVTTTLDELLDAISTATSSVIHASSTITDLETYNTSSTITDLETELNAVQTKVDNIIAGTSRETITEGTYFAFGEEDRKGTLTGNTSLDAVQAVAVLNFVKENNPGATIDDMEVVQAAYPSIVSELGISSTTPYIIIDDLFYGSYGGWKVGGRVDVYIPAGVASSLTVESVELIGTTVATFGADGDTYFLSHSDGPIIQTSSNGTTNTLTIRATLSNAGASGVNAAAANTIITQLVTYEGYEIPGPTVSFYNGTDLFTMDDSAAEIGQGTGSFELYVLPAVTDTNPIFVWSTSEVDSASMPLPPGYSWAYAVEVSVYGSTLESNSGSLTLEVNANDKYNMHGIPDSDKETLEYTSAGDLGQLFTNDAFISPIDFYSEYNGALPEYHGEKIAYRFYLQRVLLDDEGKFHGIAAGYFRFIRKE